MMILLDTNVISEAMKPAPEPSVMAWLNSQSAADLWTSTIVVAEVYSGLDLMPAGKRQRQLLERAELMFDKFFGERILAFDLLAARAYGAVLKARKTKGLPIDEMDALLAATALANSSALATRNISHFQSCGILVLNPWS
jgi:predicted nucleic acid-binding protein